MRGHWDQYVPTIPAFIVPYLLTYVWVVSTVTYFAMRLLNRQLRTLLAAGLLCVSTAIATFFLFQTDVNTITLAIAWIRRDQRWWSIGAVVLAALIIAATQVLHQHSLMAAVYGVIVATAMYSVDWLLCEYRAALREFRRLATAQPAPQ